MLQHVAPIRAGRLKRPWAVLTIAAIIWGSMIAATLYGSLRAGFAGAASGLVASWAAAQVMSFLLGLHTTPLSPLGTSRGKLQRIVAIVVLALIAGAAARGGWQRGWLWVLGAMGLASVLWRVVVVIWVRRKVGLVGSPEQAAALGRLFEERRNRNASPSAEEDAALDALIDSCEGDFLSACVLAKRNATRPTLRAIYHELLEHGGGIRVNENFLPAAALATFTTLDFLLTERELDPSAKVELLEGFFRGGKLGIMGTQSDADLLVTPSAISEDVAAIQTRLLDISSRLAATHEKGVQRESGITIKVDHNDRTRINEEVQRAIQKASADGNGHVRGESNPLKYEVAIGQLLDLVEDHAPSARVVRRHKVSRSELATLFEELRGHGANRWEGDQYAAAAALVHAETLEYLLSSRAEADMYEKSRQVLRFLQGFPLRSSNASGQANAQIEIGPGAQARALLLLAQGKSAEVVSMLEGRLGESSSDDLLYCLARAYLQLGRYADAEDTAMMAVESARHLLHMGSAVANVAGRFLLQAGGVAKHSLMRNLHLLGASRLALTDFQGANEVFREALEVGQRLRLTRRVDETVRTMAEQLNVELFDGLGAVHAALGNLDQAQVMFECALRHRTHSYGERHPETAKSRYKLGVLQLDRGDYDSARVLLDNAERDYRAGNVVKHPDFTRVLFGQARLNLDTGAYSKVLEYYAELASEGTMIYPEDDFRWIDAMVGRAAAAVAMESKDTALSVLKQVMRSLDLATARIMRGVSDRRRADYLTVCRQYLGICASLVVRHHADSSDAVRWLFELVLRYKGIDGEAGIALRRAARSSTKPEFVEAVRRLAALRAEIAALQLRRSRTASQHESTRLRQLARARERLEKQLARTIRSGSSEETAANDAARPAITSVEVAAAIPDGHTLVEYVMYDRYDFAAVPARGERRWAGSCYLAFTMERADPSTLRLVDLGDALAIDELIDAVREDVGGSGQDTEERMKKLRVALLDRLELTGRRALLIAADGRISLLPFAALTDQSGEPVLASRSMTYVGVSRELRHVDASRRQSSDIGRAVIAADPDLWVGSSRTSDEIAELVEAEEFFPTLPGARREAESLTAMLGVVPVMGKDFTKSLLRACASPVILHIASHGFYLQGPRDRGRDDPSPVPNDQVPPNLAAFASTLEDPMLRSGLLVAGANAWIDGEQLSEDVQDGLLTAEDVADLDLGRTELTVLSACDTGLGDIAPGEGVLGLRRAFTLAGSKSVVASLWEVDDETTNRMMQLFYRNLLDGMGRSEALQKAQLALRQTDPSAYAWAAFILQGDPSAIEELRKRQHLYRRVEQVEHILTVGYLTPSLIEDTEGVVAECHGTGDSLTALRLQRELCSLVAADRGTDARETIDAAVGLAELLRVGGRLEEAHRVAAQCLASSERVVGEDAELTNRARENLALVLGQLGDWQHARTLREQVLRHYERENATSVDTLGAELNLADAIRQSGDAALSYSQEQHLLRRATELLGRDDPIVFAIAGNLSLSAMQLGRLEEARELQERSLSGRRRVLGERHEQTMTAMGNLAVLLGKLGEMERSHELHASVFAWRRLALGAEHPDTMLAAHNLAVSRAEFGNVALAIDLVREVTRESERVLGEDEAFTLSSMRTLAGLLERSPNADRDEILHLRREIAHRTHKGLGDKHPKTLDADEDLALALESVGDTEHAVELVSRTLDSRRQMLPDDARSVLVSMSRAAAIWNTHGDKGRSRELLEEAVRLATSTLGSDEATTLNLKKSFAAALLNDGRDAEARRVGEDVLDSLRRLRGEQDGATLAAMSTVASALGAAGERDAAVDMLERVIRVGFRVLGERDPTMRVALHALGSTLLEMERYAEARPILEESVGLATRQRGANDARALRERYHLALALMGSGDPSVVKFLEELAAESVNSLGPAHPETVSINRALDGMRSAATPSDARLS